ncbi:hypothetical protein COCSADRAFT_34357 [Bipolaris sorokiniana ND90Pr]|uniref:Uncharacterized protein n=1 Tax=Cochliobolus sativus (strain ND90Pr / ATCC 201652) TaxID=665912 RepID=M2RLR5_COCSN|nr:uncharacterized protein COCSADRAFT_34357 [Bipolaris sorokiniana ND90Pr]EMD67569.1 hypothetical protein COCSADRAFT_34357 [Bipolaris sorokiniana ND90Pr]
MQTSLVVTSTPHYERIAQPETAAPCTVRRSENMHRLQFKGFLAAFDPSPIAPILAAPRPQLPILYYIALPLLLVWTLTTTPRWYPPLGT